MVGLLRWYTKTLFKLALKPLRGGLKLADGVARRNAGERAKRRRQANRIASLMLSEFSRLGFSRRSEGTRKKKRKKKHIRWEYPLLMTHDEVWCPLDLKRLPYGVTTNMLRDEDVLQSLEDRCHVSIRVDYLANGKTCFVARLGGSKFPEKFSINAFKMPVDAPSLAFALGMNGDGEHSTGDLTDLKHLLVVGATGGGKTTFLHCLLYWLITRNSSQDLELWLIDMKNGAELGRYEALKASRLNPHGMVRHIAFEAKAAIDVLNLALQAIQQRNEEMRKHSASNIDDLAHLTGIRFPRIVVVIDEIVMLMLDKNKIGKYSTGSWAENLMTRIASLGRSAGVHLVISTQVIQKDVLTGMILANFENRICFSVADWRKSQLAIESSDADGLPVGRAILRREGQTSEYQTCLITPQQTRLELARIKREGPDGGLGQHDETARFVRDAKLLLSVACERMQGDFGRTKLLREDGVKGVISEQRFNEIAQRLERDGVLDPGRSNRSRRVARGYFGRPHLLDVLYVVHSSHTADPHTAPTQQGTDDDCCAPAVWADSGDGDAENNTSENDDPAVCGVEDNTTRSAHDEEADEPELPRWKILDFPVELPDAPPAEAEQPKPKRKRKS